MMRKFILSASFLLGCYFMQAQNIDVLHYKFEIDLNDKNDTIYGRSEAKIVFKEAPTQLNWDLTDVKPSGKGMKITKAYLFRKTYYQYADNPSHYNDLVIVPVLSFKKGDTVSFVINYKGIPDDGLIISKNKFGDRTFFADNWPTRAHHWIACVDRPNEKASFEFLVTAPSAYSVVANGIKTEEKELGNGNKLTHWREDVALPTKVMVIGVARFAVKTFADSPKDIPVSAWVYPQDSTHGFYDYAPATDILKFFINYIAPYPYKKLANVQSKTIFGGMENASAIFYAESSVTGNRSSEDVIAHEIAHQWFGDMASEKSFAHLWLSEGFATYFSNLYLENKQGEQAFIKQLKKEKEEVIAFTKTSTHAVVDSSRNLMYLLNANSYQKGGWILHMLRNEVGDVVFQKLIQAYYNQYKGSNAETRDFEAVAEKLTGKDLRWFFDQWLYRSGVPQLAIKQTTTPKGIELTVEQLQKDVYRLTLPVSIDIGGQKPTITKMPLAGRTSTILLTKNTSATITIDPSCTILFEEAKK